MINPSATAAMLVSGPRLDRDAWAEEFNPHVDMTLRHEYVAVAREGIRVSMFVQYPFVFSGYVPTPAGIDLQFGVFPLPWMVSERTRRDIFTAFSELRCDPLVSGLGESIPRVLLALPHVGSRCAVVTIPVAFSTQTGSAVFDISWPLLLDPNHVSCDLYRVTVEWSCDAALPRLRVYARLLLDGIAGHLPDPFLELLLSAVPLRASLVRWACAVEHGVGARYKVSLSSCAL